MRGWIYRNVIFSFPTIFGGGDDIVTLYFHPWQYLVRGWIYRDIIFSLLAIFGQGVIISWHHIFTPGNILCGGDYIVTLSWLYFHSWQYLVRGDYIVTLYFHCWQYLVRGLLYHDTLFSSLTIFVQGVIISWHHIFTPDNISWGGHYIVTWYSHPWQYLVREWLYRDIIFSLLAIFGEGVIISWHYIFSLLAIFCEGVIIWWHYIFAPGNIWSWGDYIVTLYFRSWQYLVRGWLYLDIILSLLAIFREGVIISWHIFTPDNI